MSENIMAILDAIKANRVKANQELEKIRGDITLSPEGKRLKLSNAFRDSAQEHKKLITRYKVAVDTLKGDLVRDMYLHPIAYGFNTDTQIKEMRDLVEKAELAYKGKEFASLISRAVGMRDKSMIRALGSVAYANKDYASLEKLKVNDSAISKVIDFEKGFGDLADASTKVELNIMLRGVEQPKEIPQSVLNESV